MKIEMESEFLRNHIKCVGTSVMEWQKDKVTFALLHESMNV